MEDVMISLRNLAVIGGFTAMALVFLPVSVAAQREADGGQTRPQAAPASAPAAKQPDAPRPAEAGAPMRGPAQGGPDSVVRPAAAVPPERIQVEPAPGVRPVAPPQTDPRSVEETQGEPDAADK
jgi:hypothetical protein